MERVANSISCAKGDIASVDRIACQCSNRTPAQLQSCPQVMLAIIISQEVRIAADPPVCKACCTVRQAHVCCGSKLRCFRNRRNKCVERVGYNTKVDDRDGAGNADKTSSGDARKLGTMTKTERKSL